MHYANAAVPFRGVDRECKLFFSARRHIRVAVKAIYNQLALSNNMLTQIYDVYMDELYHYIYFSPAFLH